MDSLHLNQSNRASIEQFSNIGKKLMEWVEIESIVTKLFVSRTKIDV